MSVVNIDSLNAIKMTEQYVVFILDAQRYALRLSAVDRVVRMVHITLLSRAPDIVLGIVNMQGGVIPVINVRRRFRLPEREIALGDQLVVAHTARRAVALAVDTVTDVVECSEQDLIAAKSILPAVEYLEGVVKLEDGLILVHDLDTFLSLEEENSLDRALETP
ncbi:MAG TPA: chemotaxis protein CheW [Rhodocyclaceae bacterium]|nr:chemotaxis protein CheW [Rhodocyclaceae bacterium]